MKKRRIARSAAELTILDDFLRREGKLDEFEAVAIKEVLAWKLAQSMKTQNSS